MKIEHPLALAVIEMIQQLFQKIFAGTAHTYFLHHIRIRDVYKHPAVPIKALEIPHSDRGIVLLPAHETSLEHF